MSHAAGRHRVIIQWFLGHLKREHQGASTEAARAFVAHLVETRQPPEWQVEQWTAGLNWFFKEAPQRRRVREKAAVADKVEAAGVASDETELVAPVDETELVPSAGVPQGQIGRSAIPGDADGRRQYVHTLAELQDRVPVDPWYDETVRLMRVRHMAYRTEETYLGWIRRMERFLQHQDGLEAFGQEDLKRFLSYLAVEVA